MNWNRLIPIVVVVLIGAWAMHAVAAWSYFDPRAELVEQVEEARGRLEHRREILRDRPRVAEQLRGFVDRTLGGDAEAVDHRLRTRLNRIAERFELTDATVGTGKASRALSPARGEFKGSFRELRDEVDFVELEGWVRGETTYETALRLLAAIEAEPWIKRIDQVGLDERANGERVDVSIRLTTLFVPGQTPDERLDAEIVTDSTDERFASLVALNPFHLPPPPAPAPAPPEVETRRIPRFPYGQWAVTGVAETAGSAEAWLLNRRTGEARRLVTGDVIGGAVLVEIGEDNASFELDGHAMLVRVGERLGDMKKSNQ